MSIPHQNAFATREACATAFPVLARLAVGFSELARLNLSMYGAVLAEAQKSRESVLSLQTSELFAWLPGNLMLSIAAQWGADTSAMMDMALQTTATLNRFAFASYVETVQHATGMCTSIPRSVRGVDVIDVHHCAVAVTPTTVRHDIALKNHLARGTAPADRGGEVLPEDVACRPQ
ncbi:hypothetical protein [Paraburkholderia tagetis]|uniref:Phasin family protein n=1 Tax=Paraburkholderia tagetis TaxID=2913261 RepID=A0A9X1ZYD9_9BURK|nr:hypothetical protein [Paraburkholderia tagetis]MCG5078302.1 hypothetical protein [Paraburkholderia tagetis]